MSVSRIITRGFNGGVNGIPVRGFLSAPTTASGYRGPFLRHLGGLSATPKIGGFRSPFMLRLGGLCAVPRVVILQAPQNAPGAKRFRKAKHFYEPEPFHIDWEAVEKQRRAEFDEVVKVALSGRRVAGATEEQAAPATSLREIIAANVLPPDYHLEYLMLLSA